MWWVVAGERGGSSGGLCTTAGAAVRGPRPALQTRTRSPRELPVSFPACILSPLLLILV